MAKFARKGLIAAMEDGDLEGLEGGEFEGGDEAASTAMMDVAEQESEVVEEVAAIESLSFAIEEAIEDVGAAEEIVETVEEVAEADGEGGEGLTEGEAIIAEEALKICMRRLAPGREQILPSMESFRSANSRKTATRVGLEGVVDTIKSVWEKIIQAIKAMWDKLVAFFKKITNANTSLEKAAKALKDKIKKNKARVPKDSNEDFDSDTIYKNFPIGKRITADVVSSVVRNHALFASKNGNVAHLTVEKVIGMVDTAIKAASSNGASIAGSYDTASKEIGKKLVEFVTDNSGNIDTTKDDSQEFEGKMFLIAGKTPKIDINVYIPSGSNGDERYEFSANIEFVEHEGASNGAEKIEIATQQEMTKICDQVITLAKDNDKFVQQLDKTDKAVKGLIKEIDKLVDTVKDDAAQKAIRGPQMYLRRVVTNTVNKIGAFGSQMAGMNVKAGRAALYYVSTCNAKY